MSMCGYESKIHHVGIFMSNHPGDSVVVNHYHMVVEVLMVCDCLDSLEPTLSKTFVVSISPYPHRGC